MRLKSLFSFPFFIALSSALATSPRNTTHSHPHYVLHQFPNGTWVENIAIRSNNEILVTLLTTPDVYSIDPDGSNPPKLIHSFTPSLGVLGITEVEPDHFYVITGNFSLSTGNPGFGQGTVESLIFSPDGSITTSQIAAFPTAKVLNGMSTLSASQGLVVLSDSTAGTIWLLNVRTGETRIILSGPELLPPPTAGAGVNGIRVSPCPVNNDTAIIFFVNDGASTIYSFPFSLTTLSPSGPLSVVKTGISIDDFAVSPSASNQKLYLAASTENSAVELDIQTGKAELLLGGLNSTVLPGPTSAALSRGAGKRSVFYTTNGGLLTPVITDGRVYREAGKVVAIDLD